MRNWKHIKGFENLYEVSSCGLIRSIHRVTIRKNRRKYTTTKRILRPAIDNKGYERVGLMLNGKLITKKVHRLVAENYHVFLSGQEVNHIDGDKLNNNSSNLEWCSRSYNMKHAFKKGLAKHPKGSLNPRSRIDEIKAITIKTMIMNNVKLIEISRKMNISYHIIKDINRCKTWVHLGV